MLSYGGGCEYLVDGDGGVQVVDLPKGPHEPCSFFDVYSEVQILHRFQGDQRVCQILDYGVDRDAFVLVLKHYKCSLRAWRKQHTQPLVAVAAVRKTGFVPPLHDRLPLYLAVYSAVLQAVKALEVQNVVHYDLKCDNVLLEPLVCTLSEEDFWHPQWPPLDRDCPIPFRVSITDFGQSKASFVEGGECTARNRGTECVKSPEMLKLLSSSGNVDAPRASTSSLEDEISVGKAGDVWGLGCLLYELLTGEYLLYDDDWVRFFLRVTLATEELIPDEKAAKLDNYAPVIDFLRFILVRDPNTRPSLDDLIVRLEHLQSKLKRDSQLHESAEHDIFDEVPVMEDDKPQNEMLNAANTRQLRHNKYDRSFKRCQTPSLQRSMTKRSIGKKGKAENARGGKLRPRFLRLWRLCCPCCWRRDVVVMR
ncbi:hypothetical protein M758_3G053500 [Ceratodon purpureus]|nr:hypothetical protein M758_3G053500 [Ceratodon purpureus]